jgi:hypothetical protein
MPGGLPVGACCLSPVDRRAETEYYANWPADVFALVDASTGALLQGVMQYGVS